MKKNLYNFIISLLYENGVAGRTGLASLFLILLPLFAFLFITIYMVAESKQFTQYDSFIGAVEWLVTIGVGLLGYNKTIILKNNNTGGNQQ